MTVSLAPLLLILAGVGLPTDRPASEALPDALAFAEVAPDSAGILRAARSAQADFERFRENRIPAERRTGGRPCDEPIGRLCLMFASDGSSPPPITGPSRDIVEARRTLLDSLAILGTAVPGDEWILGQRIGYLVEADDLIGARQVLQGCQAREHWCAALSGLVQHENGDWIEAGRSFLTVLEALPPGEEQEWTGESYLLERPGRSFLNVSDPDERMRRRALLWRLSDPLFMVPGNVRWTAHMARLTRVRILEDAWNPFGLPWDVDLEEITLRYGWALGWERTQGPPGSMQQLQQNRMSARLDPDRRRYLPIGEELERFPLGDDGDLRVQEGRQPEGFTAPYAPSMLNLQSQTARFLRGSRLFIVHSFDRLGAGESSGPGAVAHDVASSDPFGAVRAEEAPASAEVPADLRTALYLLPVDGPVIEENAVAVREGSELRGVWTADLPLTGDHILSLEGWSRSEGRAWRARRALPAFEGSGRIRLSDPVFLVTDDTEPPATLDEALPTVRSSLRFPAGEPFRVGWEVYGLREGEEASVSIGVERAERSRLRALGEFFRVIEPLQPVTIRWDDATGADPDIVFRSIDLFVPDLDEGEYDLFIEVAVPGEEPAVARRRLVVTSGL